MKMIESRYTLLPSGNGTNCIPLVCLSSLTGMGLTAESNSRLCHFFDTPFLNHHLAIPSAITRSIWSKIPHIWAILVAGRAFYALNI